MLSLLLAGCAGAAQSGFAVRGAPDLPSPLLVAAGDAPALYLGPEADAARIAFLSERVPVLIAGAREGDRVAVRIDGPLRTRGYVSTAALRLRVQRRGRVRGAPVYVGPNDLLQLLGPAAEPDRLAVRAYCVVDGRELGPFDGSYPRVGLAASDAPSEAEALPPAQRYVWPAGSRVALREQPNAATVATLESNGSLQLDVLNQQQGWAAVRAGQGPYLIGWTELPAGATPVTSAPEAPHVLPGAESATIAQSAAPTPGSATNTIVASQSTGVPLDATQQATSSQALARGTREPLASDAAQQPAAPTLASVPPAQDVDARSDAGALHIPQRIAAEAGELRRVVAGTKVAFGAQVIAVFKAAGWARVLKSYEAGYADVFAAVDDDVTVRGLVRTIDLAPAELTETQQPAAPR